MSDLQPPPDNLPEAAPNTDNLYIFGDAKSDRDRLVAQTYLFSEYIQRNAIRLVGRDIHSILDLGCGHGQLTLVLNKLYPSAKVVGVDIDPQAVEIAKQNQKRALNVPGKIEFIQGDIQEKLPEGTFDLVYMSMVMLHTASPEKVLRSIWKSVNPGGYVWIKDNHPGIITALRHPIWSQFTGMALDTMEKIGRHPLIGVELPDMMRAIGFTDVKMEKESYVADNNSLTGRITIGVALGGLMNARKLIANIEGVSEDELLRLHKELSSSVETIKGNWPFVNVVARRPQN